MFFKHDQSGGNPLHSYIEGIVQYFPSQLVRNLIRKNVEKSTSSPFYKTQWPSNILYSPLGREVAEAVNKLKSEEPKEVLHGLQVIGDIAGREKVNLKDVVFPVIEVLLEHTSSSVRSEAAWTLWKLKDDRAVEPLMRALSVDQSVVVRETAARTLGLLKGTRATALMAKMLLDKNVPAPVRAGVATGLGSFRAPEMLSILSRAAFDPSTLVRCAVVKSLGVISSVINPTEVTFLRNLLACFLDKKSEKDSRVRAEAVFSIRLIMNIELAGKLINLLKHDDDMDVRRNAILTLAVVYHTDVEKILVKSLSDEDWLIKKNASISLAKHVRQFGCQDKLRTMEALTRVQRMFPTYSEAWREAEKAIDYL